MASIIQLAKDTLKGGTKTEIYPQTIDSAVMTTDVNGNNTTLDKMIIKSIKVGNGTFTPQEGSINLPASSTVGNGITIEGSVEAFDAGSKSVTLTSEGTISSTYQNLVSQVTLDPTAHINVKLTDSTYTDNEEAVTIPLYKTVKEGTTVFAGEQIIESDILFTKLVIYLELTADTFLYKGRYFEGIIYDVQDITVSPSEVGSFDKFTNNLEDFSLDLGESVVRSLCSNYISENEYDIAEKKCINIKHITSGRTPVERDILLPIYSNIHESIAVLLDHVTEGDTEAVKVSEITLFNGCKVVGNAIWYYNISWKLQILQSTTSQQNAVFDIDTYNNFLNILRGQNTFDDFGEDIKGFKFTCRKVQVPKIIHCVYDETNEEYTINDTITYTELAALIDNGGLVKVHLDNGNYLYPKMKDTNNRRIIFENSHVSAVSGSPSVSGRMDIIQVALSSSNSIIETIDTVSVNTYSIEVQD